MNTTTRSLDTVAINTMRGLCMDAIQRAHSGHAGAPMGVAAVVSTPWQRFLRFDHGGAHTREKIVAAAAGRFVVIADSTKPVAALHSPVCSSCCPSGCAPPCVGSRRPCPDRPADENSKPRAPGETVHSSGGSGGLVLVLNSGSSSVKFAVLAPTSGERVLAGTVEKVGTPETELRIRRNPDHVVNERLPAVSYRAVISWILGHLPEAGPGTNAGGTSRSGPADLIGVGHRVVHGGERFTASVLVDDEVIAAIRASSHLAPLHNPANLAGIEAVSAAHPRADG